jgi:hypothetical protein
VIVGDSEVGINAYIADGIHETALESTTKRQLGVTQEMLSTRKNKSEKEKVENKSKIIEGERLWCNQAFFSFPKSTQAGINKFHTDSGKSRLI